MHVILQNESFFLFNKRSVAVSSRHVDDQRPTGTVALALELDALRERTHVRNPNPGSRRARLAGAVHRDDRHLDSGTGKFVTVPVALNYRTFSRGALR
jgi:hypothetical protein